MTEEINVAASDAAVEEVARDEPEIPASPAPVEAKQEAPARSNREALERAMRAIPDQPRADDGKWIKTAEQLRAAKVETAPVVEAQAPQAATPAVEVQQPTAPAQAPTRFSKEAQDAWATVPDVVRRETERAFTEMTKGLTEYQQRWEPIRQFDEMARQAGKDLPAVVSDYVQMENHLRENPISGFSILAQRMGLDVAQLGQALAGIAPNGGAAPEVAPLMNEIAALKQQLSGVVQTFEQQKNEEVIRAWAADKPHFEHVRPVIQQVLQAGMAQDADQAYEMALRLQPPAPVVTPSTPAPLKVPASTTPAPQTRRPSLQLSGSNSGAPSNGGKVPGSAREALSSAFARVGGI